MSGDSSKPAALNIRRPCILLHTIKSKSWEGDLIRCCAAGKAAVAEDG
jgi:hypothetical protein